MPMSYEPLWKLMAEKGYRKTDLRKLTGMGTSTLAKFAKNEHVRMEILDKLCKSLHCELKDIVVYVPEPEDNTSK